MNRKQFILKHGATCDNWTWSWSFVNHDEQLVIFGAWSVLKTGGSQKILGTDWQTNDLNHKQPAYSQSREHIRLIQEEKYSLKIFQMRSGESNPITGASKISGFDEELIEKELVQKGDSWYAVSSSMFAENAEDVGRKDTVFMEGAESLSIVKKKERNGAARLACIEKYGLDCQICKFNFEEVYGVHGEGFIHVHHLNPLALSEGEYTIDPETDLLPVCPNCHAMFHRGQGKEPLSVEQLTTMMKEATAS